MNNYRDIGQKPYKINQVSADSVRPKDMLGSTM